MRLNPCEEDTEQLISCCYKTQKVVWRLPTSCPTHPPIQAPSTSFHQATAWHLFTSCPEHHAHNNPYSYNKSIFKNSLHLWCSTHLGISGQVRNPAGVCFLVKTSYPVCLSKALRVTPTAGDTDSEQVMCLSCSLGAALLHAAKYCNSAAPQEGQPGRQERNFGKLFGKGIILEPRAKDLF